MTANHQADRTPKKTVFLMRHGETASDGVKRYVGQTDPLLSPLGRKQAETWRRLFRNIPLAAIYYSDLSRTRETAAIVAADREIPLIAEPDLREIHMGSWENRAFETLRKQDPEAFRERGRQIDTYRPPGGESFQDLQRRAVGAFNRAVSQTEGGTEGGTEGHTEGHLLIVAHAGVNRAILCHILDMPLRHIFRLAQDHACLNTIVLKNDDFQIVGLNQAAACYPERAVDRRKL